jgi:hypothetical protein
MAEKEPAALTISFDQDGNIMSVQFAGGTPLTAPTHNVRSRSPDAPFLGFRGFEIFYYRDKDGSVFDCIHTDSCDLF